MTYYRLGSSFMLWRHCTTACAVMPPFWMRHLACTNDALISLRGNRLLHTLQRTWNCLCCVNLTVQKGLSHDRTCYFVLSVRAKKAAKQGLRMTFCWVVTCHQNGCH